MFLAPRYGVADYRPANDFLSQTGVTWELVGDSVMENKTVENIARIFKAAKNNGFEVFISPHCYYPTDYSWKFGRTVENSMHEIEMFNRSGALNLAGFSGSGADWLERYKAFMLKKLSLKEEKFNGSNKRKNTISEWGKHRTVV